MPRAIGEVVEGCRESWGQAIELVWAWNLVVLAIWLESLDPLPTCAIEGEKEGGVAARAEGPGGGRPRVGLRGGSL